MLLRSMWWIVAIALAIVGATVAMADGKHPAEVVPQVGHIGYDDAVAFSPDGRYALVGGNWNMLTLWEVATGKLIRSFRGHSGLRKHTSRVNSVAFSSDGRLALSGSKDTTMKLWDVTTGKELQSFSGADSIESVAFSPDGQFALSGGDKSGSKGGEHDTLILWEVATGKKLHDFGGFLAPRDSIRSVAFSPDGRFALSGGSENTLKLWDVLTGKEIRSFRPPTREVARIGVLLEDLSNEDRKRLQWYGDGGVRIVRVFEGAPAGAAGLRADDLLLMVGGEKAIDSEQTTRAVRAHKRGPALPLTFWREGQKHDVDVAPDFNTLPKSRYTYWVNSVAFSPDGRFALSASDDETLSLWDVTTGKELRSFTGIGSIRSVAFSPDGQFALAGSWGSTSRTSRKDTLILWEVATGKELHRFDGYTESVGSVAFSPDGQFALAGGKLWDVVTGKKLRSFDMHTITVSSIAFSPDGRLALSASSDKSLKLWDVTTGRELNSFEGHTETIYSVAFSPDGRLAISGSSDTTLKLWDVGTGSELRSFTGHTGPVYSVAFSPNGSLALSGSCEQPTPKHDCIRGSTKLWEVGTGKELRNFGGQTGAVRSVAFSPDGRLALSGGCDDRDDKDEGWWLVPRCRKGSMTLREVATGKALRTFTHSEYGVATIWKIARAIMLFGVALLVPRLIRKKGIVSRISRETVEIVLGLVFFIAAMTLIPGAHSVLSVAISSDGSLALSSSETGTLKLWEVATGKEVRTFSSVWERTFRALGFPSFDMDIQSVAFAPDGRFALSGDNDQHFKLWEVATGEEIRSFKGHTGPVSSVAFSPDGRFAISGSSEGAFRIWYVETGLELARMLAAPGGEWLTVTPNGFFSSSRRDTDMLAVVRGLERTTIGQVQQSLFNPDLVREALAGDPDGEVKRAAEVINLGKVLDAGPAPVLAITSHEPDSRTNNDLVTVAVRITDRGKGIGRIEWRVNGITVGVANAPADAGPVHEIKQELALDPGENAIEVLGYEGHNLLASPPVRTTVAYIGPADSVKPTLHILAIGINQYVDRGWVPPGETERVAFPPLGLARGDAEVLVANLKEAATGQYAEVRVRTALDTEATARGLDRIVSEMSTAISPRDTFIFFAAAHGYSHQGRFYLIPQDYQGGNNPEALTTSAIGQDRLQDWIANRIKAKKALILLDTCESGALTNGYAHSRVDAPASEAGVGRLHEATGRPVLTAAAAGQFAHEGVIARTGQRRGIFTWAVLDALKNGDTNGDGYIQLSELVAHVQSVVPGLAHGLARVVTQSEPVFGVQTPRFGSTGEDFAVVRRLQ
jgi:WD40 repeat protein